MVERLHRFALLLRRTVDGSAVSPSSSSGASASEPGLPAAPSVVGPPAAAAARTGVPWSEYHQHLLQAIAASSFNAPPPALPLPGGGGAAEAALGGSGGEQAEHAGLAEQLQQQEQQQQQQQVQCLPFPPALSQQTQGIGLVAQLASPELLPLAGSGSWSAGGAEQRAAPSSALSWLAFLETFRPAL